MNWSDEVQKNVPIHFVHELRDIQLSCLTTISVVGQVNNASVLHWGSGYDQAVEPMDINYYGTKNITEQLLPLIKASPAGARIVILSSSAGLVTQYPIPAVLETFN